MAMIPTIQQANQIERGPSYSLYLEAQGSNPIHMGHINFNNKTEEDVAAGIIEYIESQLGSDSIISFRKNDGSSRENINNTAREILSQIKTHQD